MMRVDDSQDLRYMMSALRLAAESEVTELSGADVRLRRDRDLFAANGTRPHHVTMILRVVYRTGRGAGLIGRKDYLRGARASNENRRCRALREYFVRRFAPRRRVGRLVTLVDFGRSSVPRRPGDRAAAERARGVDASPSRPTHRRSARDQESACGGTARLEAIAGRGKASRLGESSPS